MGQSLNLLHIKAKVLRQCSLYTEYKKQENERRLEKQHINRVTEKVSSLAYHNVEQ